MSDKTSLERQIESQAKTAINKSIIDSLTGYNSPLSNLCAKVISDNEEELYSLIKNEFSLLLNGEGFKDSLRQALNEKFAKILVSKMGGELESRVNKLKSDETTRAKITIALSNMIDDIG